MEFLRDEEIRALDRPECTLCGASGELLHSNLVDHLFAAKGLWSLRRCPDCRLVWLDPSPVPEATGALYERYHTHGEVKGSSPPVQSPPVQSRLVRSVRRGLAARLMGYHASLLSSAERFLALLLALVGPLREVARHSVMWLPATRRGRLLDVGCGAGAFLAHMQRFGWKVWGVEPDPRSAALASEALPAAAVFVGTLEESDFAPESFEAVTLSHVIEHVADPVDTLRSCRRLLATGGWLVLTTPNADSLGSARFGPHWRGWEPPRHIHIFDPVNLRRVAESAGFEVVRVHTPCAAAYFIWQESYRLARQQAEFVAAAPSVLMAIRGVLFWGFEYLLTRLGRGCGEEVLLIAEKPASSPGIDP